MKRTDLNLVPPSGKDEPVTAGLPPCSLEMSHSENRLPYTPPTLKAYTSEH